MWFRLLVLGVMYVNVFSRDAALHAAVNASRREQADKSFRRTLKQSDDVPQFLIVRPQLPTRQLPESFIQFNFLDFNTNMSYMNDCCLLIIKYGI